MTYQLLNLSDLLANESAIFIEGALLATNVACQPLRPDIWLPQLFASVPQEVEKQVMMHYQQQYSALSDPEHVWYQQINTFTDEELADFAEGFMTLWPLLEADWQGAQISDGTQRMLQALLTTWMLAIDEAATHQQMEAAGIESCPLLKEMVPNLTLMIHEVFCAADAMQMGELAHRVNPYKTIGRNDACPCGSGKKFKQCCLNHHDV